MKKDSYYEDSDTESVKSDTSNITTSSIHSGTSMASSQVKKSLLENFLHLRETSKMLRIPTGYIHSISSSESELSFDSICPV